MTTSRRIALGGGLLLFGAVLPAFAEGADGQSLIRPEGGTFFWTLITFLLLALLLGRFAWKPLLGALAEREQSIQGSLDQARQDREQAEAMVAEQRSLLEQARRERSEALSLGQRDAEKLKAEILDEARSQREQLLKQTQQQIDAGMRQARSDLRAVAVDLAIEAAGKLLSRNLDDPTHRRLIEEHLSDLEGSTGPDSLPS